MNYPYFSGFPEKSDSGTYCFCQKTSPDQDELTKISEIGPAVSELKGYKHTTDIVDLSDKIEFEID